jgi:hypothetical protein
MEQNDLDSSTHRMPQCRHKGVGVQEDTPTRSELLLFKMPCPRIDRIDRTACPFRGTIRSELLLCQKALLPHRPHRPHQADRVKKNPNRKLESRRGGHAKDFCVRHCWDRCLKMSALVCTCLITVHVMWFICLHIAICDE